MKSLSSPGRPPLPSGDSSGSASPNNGELQDATASEHSSARLSDDQGWLQMAADFEAFGREADELANDSVMRQFVERVVQESTGEYVKAARSLMPLDSKSHEMPRILGDYVLKRMIGRGGMGVVYEAEDRKLRTKVAVKVLPLASMLDERRLIRFRNEARAAAQLNHPNICRVFAFGQDQGYHYFSMQLINGRNLAEVIRSLRDGRSRDQPQLETSHFADASTEELRGSHELDDVSFAVPSWSAQGQEVVETVKFRDVVSTRRNKSENPVFYQVVAKLMMDAANAIHHAHESKIVHRDIKPSNLLIDASGRIWVVDFGLAQMEEGEGVTMPGDLLGTLRYMSPEQALAKRIVVDSRSDIYSLGATMYELLTLRPAHDGESRAEIHRQIAFVDPPSPRKVRRDVPQALETIVMRALSKNPDDRYQTAEALAADLRRYQRQEPIEARAPGIVVLGWRWAQRHREQAMTAVAMLLVLTVGSIAAAVMVWNEKQQVEAERQKTERSLDRATGLLFAAQSGLNLARDPGLAMLLADAAVQRHPAPETREALLAAFADCHELRTLNAESPVRDALARDGGNFLVTVPVRQEDPVVIWDWANRQVRHRLPLGASQAMSPRGDWLLTTDQQDVPALWNVETGRMQWRMAGHRAAALRPEAISDSGQLVALVAADGRQVRLASLVTGRFEVDLMAAQDDRIQQAFFGRGSRFAIGVAPTAIVIWDVESARVMKRLAVTPPADSPESIPRVRLSPSGEMILAESPSGIRWWDLATGQERMLARGSAAVWLDERRFSCLGGGEEIEIRDTVTGVLVRTIPTEGIPRQLACSPDRRLIATTEGPVIAIWELATGRILGRLRGHRSLIHRVRFLDNQRLVSAGHDGTARLWHVASGEERIKLSRKLGTVGGPQFRISPDSQQVLFPAAHRFDSAVYQSESGFVAPIARGRWCLSSQPPYGVLIDDRTVEVWSVDEQKRLRSFTADTPLRDAALHPQGRWLGCLTDRGKLVLDYEQGQWVVDGADGGVAAFKFHPTESLVATTTRGGSVAVWDLESRSKTYSHTSQLASTAISFSPSGLRLMAVRSGRAELHAFLNEEEPVSIQGRFTRARFTPDGAHVVTWDSARPAPISLWDAATGELVKRYEKVQRPVQVQPGVKPEEVLIASELGGEVWNYQTGESRQLTSAPLGRLVATPGGTTLVAATYSGRSMPGGRPSWPRELKQNDPPYMWKATKILTFDLATEKWSEGKTLEGTAILYPWKDELAIVETQRYGWAIHQTSRDGEPVEGWGHAGPVSFVDWIDPRRVVTTSWDGTLCVWDAGTGLLARRMSLPKFSEVIHAALDRRGPVLATATSDGVVRLWNLDSGSVVSLDEHPDQVWHVAMDPPGERMLSICRDGSARLWKGREMLREFRFEQPIGGVAFSPQADGGFLLMEQPQRPGNATCYLRVYSSTNDAVPAKIDCGPRPMNASFDATGERVLVARRDAAAVHLAATGEQLSELAMQDLRFACFAAPGADGSQWIVTGSGAAWQLWSQYQPFVRRIPQHPVRLGSGFSASPVVQPVSGDGSLILVPDNEANLFCWPLQLHQQPPGLLPREFTREEQRQFGVGAGND